MDIEQQAELEAGNRVIAKIYYGKEGGTAYPQDMVRSKNSKPSHHPGLG